MQVFCCLAITIFTTIMYLFNIVLSEFPILFAVRSLDRKMFIIQTVNARVPTFAKVKQEEGLLPTQLHAVGPGSSF